MRDRIALVREKVAESADALIVVRPANVRYLTAIGGVFDDEPASLVVLTRDAQWIVTDSRYETALREAIPRTGAPWQLVIAEKDLIVSVADILSQAGARRVALETSVEHRRWQRFAAVLAEPPLEADGWVEEARQVKDAEEIARIAAAQELTDRAFDHLVVSIVREGSSEREVALELEFFMRREGSEGVAFPPIVASGPNSALPHAIPSDRVLERGDFVVLDFGARVDGYCADMTRTVVVGVAGERQREIYAAVLAANSAGIAALRAGILGREVDAAARAVIERSSFGEYFNHGLGHGVGLDVHEAPNLGSRSEVEVPAGAVVTIEPGIYVPGFGGVRIEDLVTVEETGVRVLTRSPKDLLEV